MERREAGLGLAVAGCGSLPSKWATYTHSHRIPPHGIGSEHRTEGITRLGGPLSGLLTYYYCRHALRTRSNIGNLDSQRSPDPNLRTGWSCRTSVYKYLTCYVAADADAWMDGGGDDCVRTAGNHEKQPSAQMSPRRQVHDAPPCLARSLQREARHEASRDHPINPGSEPPLEEIPRLPSRTPATATRSSSGNCCASSWAA